MSDFHPDPDKRPWVYDCSGNKVARLPTGEPDYTKIYKENYEKSKRGPAAIDSQLPYYVDLP